MTARKAKRKTHKLVGKFPYNTLCTGNIQTLEQRGHHGWAGVDCARCLAQRKKVKRG